MEYITELTAGWLELKKANIAFENLTKHSPALQHIAVNVATCGNILGFVPDGEGELKFKTAWFCRCRLCPMCIKRRSLKQYAEACRLVDAMPEGTWLHLVLTVPNVSFDELGSAISRMNESSSRFFRDKMIRRAFRGIMRVLEVTYNPIRDDWHPHFHCLIWAPKSYCTNPRLYLKQDTLVEKWSFYVGEQIRQVHISKIKDPIAAVPEVVKYCFKPYKSDGVHGVSELEFYERIYAALHSRRTIQTYGDIRTTVRQLRLDLEGDDVEEISADEPGLLLLRYDSEKRRYTNFRA